MSVIIIYIVQPLISYASVNIPENIENPLALVLLILITIDLAVTISSLLHLKTHLENIHYRIENAADDLLDNNSIQRPQKTDTAPHKSIPEFSVETS